VDAGQTYRTVRLDASTSELMQTAAASFTVAWSIGDGTIVAAGAGNIWVSVRFPAATTFRWIKLTVTDDLGAVGYRWFPIWVHDATHMPLTEFRVTEDQRGDGREMGFEFFGIDTDVSPDVLPSESMICYWEVPYFGGQAIPDYYIDQYVGWILSDNRSYKSTQTGYAIKTGGLKSFLEQFEGFAQVYENSASPTRWYQMSDITFDKVVYLTLHWFTTAIHLCNLYKSDLDYPSKKRASPRAIRISRSPATPNHSR